MKNFKKQLAVLLSCTMIVGITPLSVFASGDVDSPVTSLEDVTTTPDSFILGDSDGNNIITANDAAIILQEVLQRKYTLDTEDSLGKNYTFLAADCDANGILTANDANILYQYILNNHSYELGTPFQKSAQTITVQPVAKNSITMNGNEVVAYDEENSEFVVDINLSGVEETSGISSYTFFVKYNPNVVQMTGVYSPDSLNDYVTFNSLSNETGLLTEVSSFYSASSIKNSIKYIPSADTAEYADVITDKTSNTLTCAELGKVKFANAVGLTPDTNNNIATVKKSGTLVSLKFKVLSSGNTGIGLDVSPEFVDGFNSSPIYGLTYTTNVIDSNIYTINTTDEASNSIKLEITAPNIVSIINGKINVNVELKNAPAIAGGKFSLYCDNYDIVYLENAELGSALTDKGFISEINTTENSVTLTFAGATDMDCNGTLLNLTFAPTDIGTAKFNFKKLTTLICDGSFTNMAQTEYVPFVSDEASTTITLPDENKLVGDVNCDGVINNVDATLILRHDAGKTVLKNYQTQVSDVNNDGDLNYKDAILILNKAAGYNVF